jgi:hypothetical protein
MKREHLIVVGLLFSAGVGCRKKPVEEVTPPEQVAKAEAALVAAQATIEAREEKRASALRAAMNLASVPVSGVPCPVVVHVVGPSESFEGLVGKAFGTDEESRRERTRRALGGGTAPSPARSAELRDARFKTEESMIVPISEAATTPSRRGKSDLDLVESYRRDLADVHSNRYRASTKGDEIAAAAAYAAKGTDVPKVELVVVEESRRSPVSADGTSHGRAYVYEPSSGKVICAGVYEAHNNERVADRSHADQFLDLETETLRAAATHVFDLAAPLDAGTDSGGKKGR